MEGGIAEAFLNAWQACENPPLDGVNPHFGNKYATLKATLGEIRSACKAHGIAYRQRLVIDQDGGTSIVSDVMNEKGEVMEMSVFPVPKNTNPQAFGSAMTYVKRQQAQADWGIVGEEDDDANSAGKSEAAPSGPCNGRCRACGSVWSFESGDQMIKTPCPKCGNTAYEVV